MDKLLSSLLCCSVDSKDDADDKIHNQSQKSRTSTGAVKSASNGTSPGSSNKNISTPPRRNSVSKDPVLATAAGNGKIAVAAATTPTAATGKQKKSAPLAKKDLLDDDNSVNETDTITNTNDESNNNTPSSNAHHDDSVPPLTAAQEAQTLAQVTATSANNLNSAESEEDDNHDDEIYEEDMEDDEESFLDLTKLQEGQAFNPETGFLLGHKDKKFGNKKCLILDLDETLVHSSFKYLRTADFVIPVEIDNQVHHVYVIKRPGVDEFLKKVGQWFEVVVFTASVSKYGDPLLDKLDFHKAVHHRLFRDSCYNYQGNFIKNLSQIGRPLSDSIIIDNSPASYIFHPQHSIPISSWFSDTHDNELIDLLPFLEDISKANVDDVGLVLDITL
ncbi:hypothetical protein G9P44_000839 [Scheffersomyces stipitis]|nr:hypothetical protein G9P44_000839 [Scheffersomyces stipitis]